VEKPDIMENSKYRGQPLESEMKKYGINEDQHKSVAEQGETGLKKAEDRTPGDSYS